MVYIESLAIVKAVFLDDNIFILNVCLALTCDTPHYRMSVKRTLTAKYRFHPNMKT